LKFNFQGDHRYRRVRRDAEKRGCPGEKSKQNLIESFLKSFDLAVSSEADGLTTLDLYRKFRLSHGVDSRHCQIAATALRSDVEV
jgi:predicted nucleic acid-binding protein